MTANDCGDAAILLGGKRLNGGRGTKLHGEARRPRAFLFVSSAAAAEPSPDFSHDFVDLVGLQESRLFFQLRPPSHQDLILPLLLVMAVVGNLLDNPFPSLKTHRFSFLDFGPPQAQRLVRSDDQSLPWLRAT
jgi:hypothetical protein